MNDHEKRIDDAAFQRAEDLVAELTSYCAKKACALWQEEGERGNPREVGLTSFLYVMTSTSTRMSALARTIAPPDAQLRSALDGDTARVEGIMRRAFDEFLQKKGVQR